MWKSEKWRHADEEKLNREQAVDELIGMLKDLIKRAKKEGFDLAPIHRHRCPGKIEEDGSIAKGAQNLPGNWESSRFNLPARLAEAIPEIGDHDTTILMHNDAVVQGLSEVPFMRDVEALGRADDRDRARQRALHQPAERQGVRQRRTVREVSALALSFAGSVQPACVPVACTLRVPTGSPPGPKTLFQPPASTMTSPAPPGLPVPRP